MSDIADNEYGNHAEMVALLGDLINASTTLQSILQGVIGGIERERALVTFDRTLEEVAALRRQLFGDPAQTAADPAANIPLSDVTNPTGMHTYNTTGKT